MIKAESTGRTAGKAVLGSLLGALVLVAALSAAAAKPSDQQLPAGIKPAAVAQIAAIQDMKASLTPAQRKIDSHVFMVIQKQRGAAIAQKLSHYRYIPTNPDGSLDLDVMAFTSAGVPVIAKALHAMGAEMVRAYPSGKSVRATLALDRIEALAAMPEVRFVYPKKMAKTNKINTSEGVITHRVNDAIAKFGTTGKGVKVCVLSDGVDSLAALQASGDLPANIDVLPGQEGSGDEGSAMLEIVHDMAPQASLGFATAFTSEESFAQNIRDLAASGCQVIVDDVIYFDESPFQDMQVAQAVNDVTATGVLYFSSAGNDGSLKYGSGTWEGNFKANGPVQAIDDYWGLPLGSSGVAHDFGDGGQSNLVYYYAGYVSLHWTDPWGASGNDYDIYDLEGDLSYVWDYSTNTQDGTGDPWEFMDYYYPAYPGERIFIMKYAGADRMLNLHAFGYYDGVGDLFEHVTNGATRGHNSAANAFGVAAVDVHEALPGPFSAANPVEYFSSEGPRRIYFDFDGNLLPGAPAGDYSSTGGVVRMKPDIAAADGVACAAPGFNPFYGTSAAAPHAAAIAAHLKQAFPAWTPTQIRTALTSSAIDIEDPGWDTNSGAGIVMAYEALQAAGAPTGATILLDSYTVGDADGCSNKDGNLQPGETGTVTVNLKNPTTTQATNAVATFSIATPVAGVFLPDPAPWNIGAFGPGLVFSKGVLLQVAASVPPGTVIPFRVTVTFAGGYSPAVLDIPVTVQGSARSVTSTLDTTAPPTADWYTATTGLQSGGRIYRDGVASTCAAPKTFPGYFSSGTRRYDAYVFTNPLPSPICAAITVTNGCGGTELHTVAYGPGGYDPNDYGLNYSGDSGSSGATMNYEVNVGANEDFTVVVHEVNSGGGVGCNYTIAIGGLPADIVPPVEATMDASLEVCENGSGKGSVTTSAAQPTYEWFVTNHTGAGVIVGPTNGDTVDFMGTTAGTFALSCKVTDGVSDCFNYVNQEITVLPAPHPTVTAPATAASLAAGLKASVPDNAGSTYAWTITNGTITAGQGTHEVTFTAGVGGTTTLSVVETAAGGCFSKPARANVAVYADGSDCSPEKPEVLCLQNGRFRATVTWQDYTTGASGNGTAVSLTSDSGYFWFTAASNLELFVKVLDGTTVNGAYWVIYGALSDVEYTLTIQDTVSGAVKTYHNPAHNLASVADVTAFVVAPPAHPVVTDGVYGLLAADQWAATLEREKLSPPRAQKSLKALVAGCAPGLENLCLTSSRFSVGVQWKNYTNGQQGYARAVTLSGDAGYFWFFGKDNLEIAVKILDGTSVNGKFWVFYAALTDVEFNLTVTDTQTGTTKTYYNPPNVLKSVADTSAF